MATIKCKMCGGDLIIEAGSTVAECEFCGTKQTVPTQDNEKKLTLFSRANRLRMNSEFDKAFSIYESIVAEFPEEAEAYWGLVLCKYGIEYVDDPATGKKIPTCHRSSFESVMDDPDLEQAIENADLLARRVYREEAKAIGEIRKGILEVSGKEEPYDIFICYKETAEDGNRTIDSVIAQDVYDALTEKGYRVFFSRISLEDKLGQEYEPYIFAALNSAKIMLAFGTDYEYYNAAWVKNEWSRYLKLMAKDKSKFLIPCFKNIDAYDMPKEFAKLQAQDMGKIGAIQDLLRGIEKILDKPATPKEVDTTTAEEAVRIIEHEKSIQQVENSIQMGILALDSGNKRKATESFESVLKINSQCIGAYIGLIRVLENSTECAPYVSKIKSFPTDRVIDYICTHRGLIGNLNNSNNLLTLCVSVIRSEALIRGILDLGIKGDAKDALIHYVDKFNDASIVKKMLESGADANATIWWMMNYKKELVSYSKVYRESYIRELHSVLSSAINAGKNKDIVRLLIEHGANVNFEVKSYSYYHDVGEKSNGSLSKTNSILGLALSVTDKTDIPGLLLESGANANYVISEGKDVTYSLLCYTVFSKKYDLSKLLLETGANPNTKRTYPRKYSYRYYDGDVWSSSKPEEYSPISDTIWRTKDIRMLELLLDHGADPNSHESRIVTEKENKTIWLRGYAKFTPLIDALYYSSEDFVQLLLKKGANPNDHYHYEGISDWSCATISFKTEIPVVGVAIIAQNRNVVEMMFQAGASFDTYAVYQTRGKYIDNSGGDYTWNEDRFRLSEYSFSDSVIAKMGDLIRSHGWKGKLLGFLGKTHRCSFQV